MITIQLTLYPDDIQALKRAINFHFVNDPDLVAIAERILEQVIITREKHYEII